jgi:uncharacterized protein YndB with AHSA1/START domain
MAPARRGGYPWPVAPIRGSFVYRFSRQGLIKAQPHQVFDFVTDQSKLPSWSPEVVRSEVVGGGPIAAGTRIVQKIRRGPWTTTTEVLVLTHDRPRTYAVTTRIMGVELHFTFSFWPEGNATRVTLECTCEGKGLAALWADRTARMVERADDQRLQRLKAGMERGA